MSIPRKSEYLNRVDNFSNELTVTTSQRPNILTYDQSGAPVVNFNSELHSKQKNTSTGGLASRVTTAFEKKSQPSPPIKEMSTEFKCRYKELTWVQKGLGRGGNLDYKAEFQSMRNQTMRGALKKRASENVNQQ